MKRRKFVVAASTIPVVLSTSMGKSASQEDNRQIYEWKEYLLRFGTSRNVFETYLENALIPALNRLGSKVGVYEDMDKTMPAKIYLLVVHSAANQMVFSGQKLQNDAKYLDDGAEFLNVSKDRYPIERVESDSMLALDGMPGYQAPENNNSRIYEWRSYEGYNADAVRRKIKMFNQLELDLFHRTGLIPVFFAENISGSRLPRLTYMLSFKDMEEREANWRTFIDHPEWKAMSGLDEYANTVSSIQRKFLSPLKFSQI